MIEVVIRYLMETPINDVWQRFSQEVIILDFFTGIRVSLIMIAQYISALASNHSPQRSICFHAEFIKTTLFVFQIYTDYPGGDINAYFCLLITKAIPLIIFRTRLMAIIELEPFVAGNKSANFETPIRATSSSSRRCF